MKREDHIDAFEKDVYDEMEFWIRAYDEISCLGTEGCVTTEDVYRAVNAKYISIRDNPNSPESELFFYVRLNDFVFNKMMSGKGEEK